MNIFMLNSIVWMLFVGVSSINGHDLATNGLTYMDVESIRNASPEYHEFLRQEREKAKVEFLRGREMGAIWVGDEHWTVYAKYPLPFIMFTDRHWFNPSFLRLDQATLNQMNGAGRMLGSNALMHGEHEFTAEKWQRMCILEQYIRHDEGRPRDRFLSMEPVDAFYKRSFYTAIYYNEETGWGMVMVAKSTILIPKGVYVKFQGSEIRVADGIHQGRHATEFVAVTNPGLIVQTKFVRETLEIPN